ncbi:MAG TPA: Snf7 family protein [Candidatus Nanoarchaeia archaeon]|nr:Snf7 family protein [Candidatus Nanoarchaeia archaeon]
MKILNTQPAPPPVKELATKSIYTLKAQQNKLDQASYRLKERDKVLFETCMGALKKNNKERAAVCANEIAEVRKLLKFLYNVQLAIERVVLRLETISELSEIVLDLKPALRLLQGVSQELFQVLPDVSAELNTVQSTISETLYATKVTADADSVIPVGAKTEGGEEILKEVSSFLQSKIEETLPEPPFAEPKVEVKHKAAPVREMVALGASCSSSAARKSSSEFNPQPLGGTQTVISYKKQEIQEISLTTVPKSSIEDLLLEYVRKSNGEIDLTRCSTELKTSNKEIEDALESLGNKGKIKIELKSPE